MNEIYKNGSNANIMPLKVTRSTGQRAVPAASCVQPLLRDMDCQEGVAVVPGQTLPGQKSLPGQRLSVVSSVWMEHSAAGCLGKQQGAGTAPGVRAWHTSTQPCPAADSLLGAGCSTQKYFSFLILRNAVIFYQVLCSPSRDVVVGEAG